MATTVPGDPPEPLLTLDDRELRRLGYRVVDLIADHWAGVGERPPITVGEPAALAARLAEEPPEHATPVDDVLAQVLADVLPYVQHGDHPRFYARIPGPSNPVGVLADALASGLNVFVGSWTGGSGPATVELVTLDWMRRICGLPEGSEGAFVSGGSVATLNALAAARAARLGGHDPGAVVYVSDQAHAAVSRALRVLGFADDQVRTLASDADLRLPADATARAVAEDRRAGRRPFCVVATAGSTNTGAVDPLEALADLCAAEGMWLHADAAYGGPAILSETGRRALAGLDRVDSLAIDPHKWLFQPYECGCLLVRHPGALAQAFALHPEYLADVSGGHEEVNFFDRGVQLTRGFRALKLWMTIKVFGLDELRRAVEHGIALAEHAERTLREAGWGIVTPAQLGIVSFARERADAPAAELDRLHLRTVAEMQREGTAAISSTVLRGRTVLRMCTINPRGSTADVERAIAALDRAWAAAQEG
jgi:aromatic-L-amino-acid/L-tryptophan decarboxylase